MQVTLRNKQTIDFNLRFGRDFKDTEVCDAYIVETGRDATDQEIDEIYAYNFDLIEEAYANYHADPEDYLEVTSEIYIGKVGDGRG